VIRGVSHNIPFLTALIEHPEFRAGNLTTAFIDEHYPDGFDSRANTAGNLALTLAAAAHAHQALAQQSKTQDSASIQHTSTTDETDIELVVVIDKDEHNISIDNNGYNINGTQHHLTTDWRPGQLMMHGEFNGQPFTVQLDREGVRWRITQGGTVTTLLTLPPHVAELNRLMLHKVPPDMSKFLLSPMPGLLMRVAVEIGDSVNAGQELAVVEAMKMENVLSAEQSGIVKAIPATAGSSLAVDEVIIEFE